MLAAIALLALPQAALAQSPSAATTGVGSQFELTFWQSVESGNDPALYEAYLQQYPNGTFATVARVKLAKLRQIAAPPASPSPAMPTIAAQPAPVQVAPAPVVPAATPAVVVQQPAQAPVATAAAQPPVPAPVMARPAARPAPAHPAAQLVAASTPVAPPATPPVRERLAGRATVPRPTPANGDDSAPYVTPAPPTEHAAEPAGENGESAALRRLLGALGDSQRSGAPAPVPITDEPDAPAATPAASDNAALAPAGNPALATPPSAAPSRLVETTATAPVQPALQPALQPAFQSPGQAAGPIITVPDAAALSASHAPVDDPHPIAVGQLPPGFALPPRPQLAAIPPLAFPGSFCSAEARNAFHDGPYITAVEAAKRNNDAAIAYLHLLQDLYDTNQLSGDINPVNAIAAEARAYGPVAAAAFSAQSTLVSAFNTLMAVPIVSCGAPKQP